MGDGAACFASEIEGVPGLTNLMVRRWQTEAVILCAMVHGAVVVVGQSPSETTWALPVDAGERIQSPVRRAAAPTQGR